jgi:hypothetical protein
MLSILPPHITILPLRRGKALMHSLTSRLGRQAGWRTQGRSGDSRISRNGEPTSHSLLADLLVPVHPSGPGEGSRLRHSVSRNRCQKQHQLAPSGATAPTPTSGHCACFVATNTTVAPTQWIQAQLSVIPRSSLNAGLHVPHHSAIGVPTAKRYQSSTRNTDSRGNWWVDVSS